MPLKKCSGLIERGANAIAEVKAWSATHAAAEDDTSIINNNCVTRTSVGEITYSLSLNVYQDPTDAEQTALGVGTTGHAITIYPAGNATGMPKRVYADCVVTNWDDSGEFTGSLEANIQLKCNGGLVESLVA